MRIAVISDIHGNLPALEAVLEDIQRSQPDHIVNLGDCVSGPLWPRETFERLKALNLPTVRGNHDRQVAEFEPGLMAPSDRFAHDELNAMQRLELGLLPFRLEFFPDIVGFHATPQHDDRYLLDAIVEGRLVRASIDKISHRLGNLRAKVVLIGHSHRQDMLRLPSGQLIINPGSVGCPAYEDDTGQAHCSEAGTPHARYMILDINGAQQIEVTARAVSYDYELAARQAEQTGRRDWAYGLRTGFMSKVLTHKVA